MNNRRPKLYTARSLQRRQKTGKRAKLFYPLVVLAAASAFVLLAYVSGLDQEQPALQLSPIAQPGSANPLNPLPDESVSAPEAPSENEAPAPSVPDVFGNIEDADVTARAEFVKLEAALEITPPLITVSEDVRQVVGDDPVRQHEHLLRIAFLDGDETRMNELGQWFQIEGAKDPAVNDMREALAVSYDLTARKSWNDGLYDWPANTIVVLTALGEQERAGNLRTDVEAVIVAYNEEVAKANATAMAQATALAQAPVRPNPTAASDSAEKPAPTEAVVLQPGGSGDEPFSVPELIESPLWEEDEAPVVGQVGGSFGLGLAVDPILWNMRDVYDVIVGQGLEDRPFTILRVVEESYLGVPVKYVFFGETDDTIVPELPQVTRMLIGKSWHGRDQNGHFWWVGVSLGGKYNVGERKDMGSIVKSIWGLMNPPGG